MTNRYDAALSPAGLTVAQYALLNGFARMGDVSISEAAKSMQLDRTTLGRNLAPLQQAGLIVLGAGAKDARERKITLTTEGRAAIVRAAPLWRQTQDELETRIGAAKLAELHALLSEIESIAS